MTAPAVDIATAARMLNASVRTLQREIAAGAPVIHRGARGRGRATLIDVEAFAAWRRTTTVGVDRSPHDDLLLALAAEIPELVAGAVHEAFVRIDGPHKRTVAGALAGAGYMAIVALLDRIRGDAPDVPELTTLPEKIGQLCRIFDGSGKMRSTLRREER